MGVFRDDGFTAEVGGTLNAKLLIVHKNCRGACGGGGWFVVERFHTGKPQNDPSVKSGVTTSNARASVSVFENIEKLI